MEDDYKSLYQAVSAKFDIGSFEEFAAKMQTQEERRRFYDAVSNNGFDLGEYDTYESRLKKKEDGESLGIGEEAPSTEPKSIMLDTPSSAASGALKSEVFLAPSLSEALNNFAEDVRQEPSRYAEAIEKGRNTDLKRILPDPKEDEKNSRVAERIKDNLILGAGEMVDAAQTLGWSFGPLANPSMATITAFEANQRAEAFKETMYQSERGFLESISDGDYSEAAIIGLETTARSAPLMILSAATGGGAGGYAAISALAGAQTYNESVSQDWFQEMSPVERAGYATVMGGLESVGEMAGGKVLRAASKDFAKGLIGKEAFDKTVGEFTRGALKSIGIGMSEEGVGEFVTGFGQSIVQQAAQTGADSVDYIKAFKDGFEGAALGAFSGGAISTVGQIPSSVAMANSVGVKNAKLKNRAEIQKLSQKFEAAQSEEERFAIGELLDAAIQKDAADVNRSVKLYNMIEQQNPDEFNYLYELDASLRRKVNQYEASSDTDVKKALRADINRLSELKNKIEGKYDSQEEAGVPSAEQQGQAPIQAEPIQEPSAEAPAPSGVVQAPQEVEATVLAAPFYDTKVENIEGARTLRQSEPYKKQIDNIFNMATTMGVELVNVDESIGGFVNDKGEKIVEVSNIIRIKGTPEQVQQYAAIMAAKAPEVQEATIAANYVEENSNDHDINELTIKVDNIDGAIEALKAQDIYDFTINDSEGTITFLDFSKGVDEDFRNKMGKFAKELETKNINYEESDIRAIKSEYIGPSERGRILSSLQEALVQQGQTGTELYNEVTEALKRHKEFTGEALTELTEDVQSLIEQPKEIKDIYSDRLNKNIFFRMAEYVADKFNYIFTPGNKDIIRIKERYESKKDRIINRTNVDIENLEKLLKPSIKTLGNERVLELINNVVSRVPMQEDIDAITALKNGENILDILSSLRARIDSMSMDIINNPAFEHIDDELKAVISGNLQSYLRTSYRFFKDKKWNPSEKDIKYAQQQEVAVLISERINELVSGGMSQQEAIDTVRKEQDSIKQKAEDRINDYLKKLQKNREVSGMFAFPSLKLPSSSFKAKAEIPEHIQRLLGVIEDPINRVYDTIHTLATLTGKGKMMYDINELLGGDYVIDANTITQEQIDSGNYRLVKDEYSSLNNKYVHNDIFTDLVESPLYRVNPEMPGSSIINGYFKALVLMRKTKVLYNLPTWRKNIMGGWYFIMLNNATSITNPKQIAKDLTGRAGRAFTGAESAEIQQNFDEMAEEGLLGASVDAKIVGQIGQSYHDMLSSEKNKAQQAWDWLLKKESKLGEKYGAVDDYTKMVVYRSEKAKFSQKLYGDVYENLSAEQQAEVRKAAAERTKQNTPTISRLPRVYRTMARLPFGDFLSFRLESFRSFTAAVNNAKKDFVKGMTDTSLSPAQKKAYLSDSISKLGMAGFLATMNYYGYQVIANLFANDDEEELVPFIKNNVMLLPEWMRGNNVLPTKMDKDGKVSVMNLSSEDPYDEVFNMILGRRDMSRGEAIMGLFKDVYSPNMVVKTFYNLIDGKDQYGKPISEDDAPAVDKILDFLGYIGKQFVPPTMSYIYRTEKERMDKAQEEGGEYDVLDAIGSSTQKMVWRDYTFDVTTQFYYNMKDRFGGKTEWKELTPSQKSVRMRDLESVREAYIALQRYADIKNNPEIRRNAKGTIKRLLSRKEYSYVVYGTELNAE